MSQPVPLQLVTALTNRYDSTNVDARLVNCFIEQGQTQREFHVYKRPGFKYRSSVPAGVARGLYNWNNNLYSITDGNLYKDGFLMGAVNNAGVYSFAPCLGSSPKLFLKNGTNAYTIDGAGVLTAVSDVDYPATTVSGAVYLNGTTYVMDNKAVIYGSDGAANDPASWDPLNQIVAQIEPTAGVHLAKQLAYVLALKQFYTEAFYDAGNPAASPLGSVSGSKMNYGCVDARTVKDLGGDLMWVANTGEGTPCVVLVANLKLDIVSDPRIERILETFDFTTIYSWGVRVEGHRFYGVTSVGSNLTLVFDLTVRTWYIWKDPAGNYLPYAFSAPDVDNASKAVFLHATNGRLFNLDVATFQDDSVTFRCDIYTPNFDANSRRTKTLARLDIHGDQVASTLALEFSDDDYQSWTAGPPIDLSLRQPFAADLGEFYKRAFHFSHQANTAMRIQMAEIYLGMGVG